MCLSEYSATADEFATLTSACFNYEQATMHPTISFPEASMYGSYGPL